MEQTFVGRTKTVVGSFLTAAFRFRDNFNDAIIQDENFIFYINNEKANLVKKQYGYYIIANVWLSQFSLKVSSKNYFTKTIEVNLSDNKINSFIETFLIPNYAHYLPPSNKQIVGKVDANTFVYSSKFSSRTNVRFQNIDESKKVIIVSNPVNDNLEGKLISLVNLDNLSIEPIFIKRKISQEEHEYEDEIGNIDVKSMPIQKTYITRSDNNGMINFYVGYEDLPGDQYIVRFTKEKKTIYKVIDFINSKSVTI